MIVRMEIIPMIALIAANFIPEPNMPAVVAPNQPYMEMQNGETVVERFGMTVAEIKTLEVFDVGGQRLGEVDDVLADGNGNAKAVVVDVGGFLGLGEKEVAVAFDALTLDGRRLMASLSKAQIEALPERK